LRRDVATAQLERLREILGRLRQSNPFYAPRLRAAGVHETVASLEEFAARMPFTTKGELAADEEAHPPFGTNLTEPPERYTRFCQTSGTTARPLAILDTPESWQWMLGNWAKIYEAAEVRAGDRLYFAFSFGPFLGFWTAFEAALQLGCLCLPGGGLSSSARLRALAENGATVLCCTPTYALHLGEAARTEGTRSAIRKIIVAGEPGGSVPEIRAHIVRLWPGAEVLDHYGLTEVGPVAYQRLGAPGVLHIIESSYLAEIVEPGSGEPVSEGATGELVLTSLGRSAWPLLRYRTGDLVARDPAAEGFALPGGVLGRADDMLVVRGVNLFPSAVEAVIRSIAGVGEYRVEVSRRGAMAELAIVAEVEGAEPLRRLEAALTAAFSLRIPVAPAEPGSLPRFEMKARRWVRQDI
jgi:phenylacetate-CoA ligase